MIANLRWFSERRFLRGAFSAVGVILSRNPGFQRERITYQFLDHDRQRHGGTGPIWNRYRDNAVIVFYRPDQSRQERRPEHVVVPPVQPPLDTDAEGPARSRRPRKYDSLKSGRFWVARVGPKIECLRIAYPVGA